MDAAKQLTIRKISYTYNDSVHRFSEWQMGPSPGLTWDEMLGFLSESFIKLNDEFFIRSQELAPAGWCDRSPKNVSVDLELVVTYFTSSCITIQSGERFIRNLSFSEMLGFVACLTLTGNEMFGGMKTYEQHNLRPFTGIREPEALIAYGKAAT